MSADGVSPPRVLLRHGRFLTSQSIDKVHPTACRRCRFNSFTSSLPCHGPLLRTAYDLLRQGGVSHVPLSAMPSRGALQELTSEREIQTWTEDFNCPWSHGDPRVCVIATFVHTSTSISLAVRMLESCRHLRQRATVPGSTPRRSKRNVLEALPSTFRTAGMPLSTRST